MTAGPKPYLSCKDSGVEWLGQVPEHWEVRRIKTLFREKDERSGDGSGELLSLTRAQGIVRQSEASSRIASAEDLSKYKLCRPHDLVMNRMQAWSGMFAVSSLDGVVSPDYSIFVPTHSLEEKYFEQLFKTPLLVHQFAQRSKGIGSGFNRLYTPDFGAVPVVAPPLPEQAAIACYLDYMDRRIRRYVRAKQKLIKLLEEQKQVIIHEAVTGQIDVRTDKPYPAYKDSGVEWLGQVPEHWEVRRLKQAFRRVIGGSTPASGNTLFWDGDVVWITPGDVSKSDRLKDSLRHIKTEGLASCSAELVPPGSIIVTSRAPVGNVALAQVQLCTNQGCKALVPSGSVIDSLFALALLKTVKAELQSLAVGTTFTEISTGRLGTVPIPVPPLSEQAAIVRFLNDVTANAGAVVERTKSSFQNEGYFIMTANLLGDGSSRLGGCRWPSNHGSCPTSSGS